MIIKHIPTPCSILGALMLGATTPVSAQTVLHETPDYVWPAAQLEQAAWLAGTWRGVSDEGDEVHESWVGPIGALMAGASVEYAPARGSDEASNWSENMVIVSNGYSLAFHNSTFLAEEGGYGYIERRLLRIEDDGCKLFFHGVTIECERAEDSEAIIGMTVNWKQVADEFNPAPELYTYRYKRVMAE